MMIGDVYKNRRENICFNDSVLNNLNGDLIDEIPNYTHMKNKGFFFLKWMCEPSLNPREKMGMGF